ncbi:SET domain-containing protein [Phellopilus nigrolimitatus]|nr:SET domain-containing protein [Phellopilus nigrolimitatus]
MTSLDECSEPIKSFRTWFLENGGELHRDIHFIRGSSGLSVRTQVDLQSDTTVVSCPFSLAITLETVREPLQFFGSLNTDVQAQLSERQRICAYISLHWIFSEVDDIKHLLRHRPYIDVLPRPETLLTPLYFSEAELNLFRGTNLYGATSDQRTTWDAEWQDLCSVVRQWNPEVANRLTRDMYLSSATYLSSRAFPSTLLSSNPSLVATPSSYPVLLPGVDSLNHARNQPVTWSVSRISRPPPISAPEGANVDHCVVLTLNTPSVAGEELFNNYGPKPNASLILGYGFALEDNPDDTIMLKVGTGAAAASDEKFTRSEFEIGRDVQGVDALWSEVRARIATSYGVTKPYSNAEVEESWEEEDIRLIMETADTLSGMVTSLLHRLPSLAETTEEVQSLTIRESVRTMWGYYVRGQADILEALLAWLDKKDQEAVRKAQEAGIDIQVEDDDED